MSKKETEDLADVAALSREISKLCHGQEANVVMSALMTLIVRIIAETDISLADAIIAANEAGLAMSRHVKTVRETKP